MITLLFPLLALADGIDLHTPGAEEILPLNRIYECAYLTDNSYGFQFTRINEQQVRVELLTNGQLEGERSAFVAEIKGRAVIGYHLYFYERKENFGRYVEFELLNTRRSYLGGRFPGQAMQVSALYEKKPDGTEEETRYPDFSRSMSCALKP
jgi:hypothetical protein